VGYALRGEVVARQVAARITCSFFYVLLTVHLSIIVVFDQLNAQILVL